MATTLADALAGLDAPPQNPKAMAPLDEYLDGQLGLPKGSVYSIRVGHIGRLRKQVQQSDRGDLGSVIAVVYRNPSLVEKTKARAPKILGGDHKDALVVLLIPSGATLPTAWTVFEPADGTVAAKLQAQHANVQREVVVPDTSGTASIASAPQFAVPVPATEARLIVDPRIRRMLRLAIASSNAVMLIGPPGTGKTTLLAEAMAEARENPSAYGLSAMPEEALQVTPEEGWTTRELIGGESVDDKGQLRFKPGHVLDAIRRDRWLILDEANRADMDRIFGGLLTFLSKKRVSLGRASGAVDCAEILLDWGTEPHSVIEGLDRLEAGVGEDIVFYAGTDWRLLGTYNALDAHRVFRFGQALGRRFARVPVPAITVEEFVVALQPHLEALSDSDADVDRVESVLTGLYAAHQDLPTPVGPALFLHVPGYIASGLAAPGETDEADSADDFVDHLIAEGYLLGAGPLLAQLDGSARESFHARVVTTEGLFSEAQWSFVANLLPALS